MKHNSEVEKAAALEKLKFENLQARIKEREAESKNSILLDRCVKVFEVAAMTLLLGFTVYIEHSQMYQIYENATNEAESMVCNKTKLLLICLFLKSLINMLK